MRKRLFIVALLALLSLGCAAKDPEEQGKRLGAGVGAAAGASVLAAVGNPCAGVALLVQGALEATGVNDALGDLGRNDPDPKFVAFMEELQRETAERRAARQRAQEARLGVPAEDGGVIAAAAAAPAPAGPALTPEKEQPGFTDMDPHGAATPKTGQTMAENAR